MRYLGQYFTLPHGFRTDPCGLHGLRTELVGLRTELVGLRTDLRGIHGLHTELVGLRAELVRLHTELVGLHTDGASPDFMESPSVLNNHFYYHILN